ncbi:hypothetical protein DN550_33445 [Burkholderia multivorans]|nr:hypothetical protein DN508_32130 [Burkholderia multivorans]RAG62791.1 hypothetical protein DN550_33445 [Burkholderia multivorans]
MRLPALHNSLPAGKLFGLPLLLNAALLSGFATLLLFALPAFFGLAHPVTELLLSRLDLGFAGGQLEH